MDTDRMWFNQSLLYHKDLYFNSNSTIEISLTSSSTDLKMFSAPTINLSIIHDNYRKACTIYYQNANDLVESVRKLFNESTGKSTLPIEIFRKIGEKGLKIVIKKYMDTTELVADITVTYSDSDVGRVVIPFQVFLSIMNILKDYVNNYIGLSIGFSSRVLLTELMNNSIDLKNSIKALPSFISSNIQKFSPSNIPSREEEPKESNKLVEELNTFMDTNLDKINIPELKSMAKETEVPRPSDPEIDSKFIKTVLKYDIKVLEDVFNSAMANRNFDIKYFLKDAYLDPDNVVSLPGITENELKSINYIGKLIFGSSLYKYVTNKVPFPQTITVLKYRCPSGVPAENVELAYDLLLISGFLRAMKSRLESRITDAMSNKTFLYTAYRCFTDPYCFSFLLGKDVDVIKSCVLSRFKNYSKNGFFTKFDDIMKNYNVPIVSETDIRTFVEEVGSKVLNNNRFVEDIHNDGYKSESFKVPFVNSFTLEQIINEVVPVEIAKLSGLDITKSEELSKVVDIKSISKEVLDILKKGKIQEPKQKKTIDPVPVRFVKFYKDEIPEKNRDKFINYIEKLGNANYDFMNPDFPIEEIGENIIKGLYVWNESDKEGGYTDFYVMFENTIMTKDLILSKVKGVMPGTAVVGEDWGVLNNVDY